MRSRTTETSTFARNWLTQSLSDEHSPLEIDDYEMRSLEREARSRLSKEIDPAKRKDDFEKLRSSTVEDSRFLALAGAKSGAIKALLGGSEPPLLHDPSGSLEKPSAVRGALLEILDGTTDVRDQYAFYGAKDLAAKVPASERKLSIAQIEEARSSLAPAMARLPAREPNRFVSGTRPSDGELEQLDSVLAQALARLKLPKLAAAIDAIEDAPHAANAGHVTSHYRRGFEVEKFQAVRAEVDAALASGKPGAREDAAALFGGFKSHVDQYLRGFWGKDPGFSTLTYREPDTGRVLQRDVAKLERALEDSLPGRAVGGRLLKGT